MSEYHAFGFVHPRSAELTLDGSFRFAGQLADGTPLEVSIDYLTASEFKIHIVAPAAVDLLNIRDIAEQTGTIFVDTYGFMSAAGYSVEVASCVDVASGDARNFVRIDLPEAHVPAEKGLDEKALFELLAIYPQLRRAFGDLRLALLYRTDTPVFAYRAIEAVRQAFDSVPGKPNWNGLHDALNTRKTGLDRLTEESEKVRHGALKVIDGPTRLAFVRVAREVVARYCHYLLRHNSPLALPEFPTLDAGWA
jgi:hypothetical protein